MSEPRPALYLDKGVFGALDLHEIGKVFQIFYSEATLFDLLNDQSGCRDIELRILNDVHALYLCRDSDRVFSKKPDAIDFMNKIDPFELEIMTNTYRFFNGGGTMSLHDVMCDQLSPC